jgi:hypothetical protein
MSTDVYGVLGIYSPLETLIPRAPSFVHVVLLPFRGVIITDGLIESPPIQISFGPGARRSLNAQYAAARDSSRIRTRLVAEEETPRRRRPQRGAG